MEEVKIRLAKEGDKKYLIKWLSEKGAMKRFPMYDKREIENSATIWMSYMKQKSVLTVEYKGEICGTALIYIQKNKKFAHQALFAIIVGENYRGKGIGTELLKELMKMGKEKFNLEILHLEAYEENPAISLYRRFGFKEYGFQKNFIKEEEGKYFGKVMMQKYL